MVDPVNKDHTRFGIIIGRLHDFIPKPSGGHRLIGFPVKYQIMLTIGFHCLHKGIRDKHGDIKHPQPRRIRFSRDKVFYIGMVTAHCGHHRTAPRSGAHDGAAHRIPDIHERQRPRGIGRHAGHKRTFGPQRAKVIPNAAALLHGQRRFFEHIKYAAHTVGDGAHNKTVEKRDFSRGSSAGRDPAGWQEFEIFQSVIELFFPLLGIFFNPREIGCNAPPAVFDRGINRGAIGFFQAIFHIPDLFGNRGSKARHRGSKYTHWLLLGRL